jgi:hypothetical protein
MNDDLEPRLRDALHSGSLPPAPSRYSAPLSGPSDSSAHPDSGGWLVTTPAGANPPLTSVFSFLVVVDDSVLPHRPSYGSQLTNNVGNG